MSTHPVLSLVPEPRFMRRPFCKTALENAARAVSAAFGIPLADIRGHRRFDDIARARHAVWLLVFEEGYNKSQIGRAWGVDHGTILNGIRRAEDWRDTDAEFRRCLASARQAIEWDTNL